MNLYSGLFSNSSSRYSGDDLIPIPWGTRFFIIFIALLIFGGSLQLDKTFVCTSQYSYCTLESHNYFNIKKSKKFLFLRRLRFVILSLIKYGLVQDIIAGQKLDIWSSFLIKKVNQLNFSLITIIMLRQMMQNKK